MGRAENDQTKAVDLSMTGLTNTGTIGVSYSRDVTVLELDDITKSFGGIAAVSGVSLHVKAGELVGIIGPNGAGKSTLFNVMTGIMVPERGRCLVMGEDVRKQGQMALARRGVGRTFQTPRGFGSMTVRENIAIGMLGSRDGLLATSVHSRQLWRAVDAPVHQAGERCGVGDIMDTLYGRINGAQARRVELARQVVRNPALMLLDEPTAGLDSAGQKDIKSLVVELVQAGTSVVIVEHNLPFLLDLVRRVVVMVEGSVLVECPPEEVYERSEIVNAYFGGSA